MDLPVETLERSFDLVAPQGVALVDHLYANIFARAPSVLPLFSATDMNGQKKMLLQTLVVLRKSLRNLDAIMPALQNLGARHARYGVVPAHYPVVGGPCWRRWRRSAGTNGSRNTRRHGLVRTGWCKTRC